MKKLLLISGIFLLMVIGFSSCETEDCEVCYLGVFDDSGNLESKSREAEYCEDELDDIKAEQRVDDPGGGYSEWVCE